VVVCVAGVVGFVGVVVVVGVVTDVVVDWLVEVKIVVGSIGVVGIHEGTGRDNTGTAKQRRECNRWPTSLHTAAHTHICNMCHPGF
jgi:hypothetical protein